MRAIRRHHISRMKVRAARLWSRWNPPGHRNLRENTFTRRDFQSRIGRMAQTHCTHQCVMCKFEKHFSKPKISDIRADLYRLDLAIEEDQQLTEDYGRGTMLAFVMPYL